VPTNRTFAVSIDEIKQNFVFGDTFSDGYRKTVTMSDGSLREITLRPVMRNGELVMELKDGEHISYMGLNGTATHGALMIKLADMGVLDDDSVSTVR
jgi:hypothetical protein